MRYLLPRVYGAGSSSDPIPLNPSAPEPRSPYPKSPGRSNRDETEGFPIDDPTIVKQVKGCNLCMALSCVQLFHALSFISHPFMKELKDLVKKKDNQGVIDHINSLFLKEGCIELLNLRPNLTRAVNFINDNNGIYNTYKQDNQEIIEQNVYEIIPMLLRALASPWNNSGMDDLISNEGNDIHALIKKFSSPKFSYHVLHSKRLCPENYRHTTNGSETDTFVIYGTKIIKEYRGRRLHPLYVYPNEEKIDVIDQLNKFQKQYLPYEYKLLGGILTAIYLNKEYVYTSNNDGHEVAFYIFGKEYYTMDTLLGERETLKEWMNRNAMIPVKMECLMQYINSPSNQESTQPQPSSKRRLDQVLLPLKHS